ncbi:MAG: DUF5312 family protein [Alkalispirochaeta sp.]
MRRNTFYTTPHEPTIISGASEYRAELQALPVTWRWYYRVIAVVRGTREDDVYRARLTQKLAREVGGSPSSLYRVEDRYLDEGFFKLLDEARETINDMRAALEPIFRGSRLAYVRFLLRDVLPAVDREFQMALRSKVNFLEPQGEVLAHIRRQVTDTFHEMWEAQVTSIESRLEADWKTYVAVGLLLEFPISTVDSGVPKDGAGRRSIPLRVMTPALADLYRVLRYLSDSVREATLRRMDRFFDVIHGESDTTTHQASNAEPRCRAHIQHLLAIAKQMELLKLIRVGTMDPKAQVASIHIATSQLERTKDAYEVIMRDESVRYAMQSARIQLEPILHACAGPALFLNDEPDAFLADRVSRLPGELDMITLRYVLVLVAGSRLDQAIRSLFDAIVDGSLTDTAVAATIHQHISIMDQVRAALHELFFTGATGEGKFFHMVNSIQRTSQAGAQRFQRQSAYVTRTKHEVIDRVLELIDAMTTIADTLTRVRLIPREATSVSSWKECAVGLRNLLLLESGTGLRTASLKSGSEAERVQLPVGSE